MLDRSTKPRNVTRLNARPTRARLALAAAWVAAAAWAGFAGPSVYGDVSAPATLQLFESSWRNAEKRAADAFIAGYGGVWLPPPGRADSGNFSVGYDVYNRFDLGRPGSPTLYGTERGLRSAVGSFQRFGGSVYADLVWNHNGFRDSSTPGFAASGDYPGFVTTAPGAPDGDFHSAFAGGTIRERLAGLIDIDHSTNLRYIRNPVTPGDSRNIPNEAATEANRRFYPGQAAPGRTYFDPRTGESFTRHDFGTGAAGTPVQENALGYLMRNAQWLVQDVGFDGFRLDATKHMEPWVLNYLDRAVYEAGRQNLDGSRRTPFSFGEALTGDSGLIQQYVRKDINPATPGVVVGGNRDALDFPLHFALKQNLSNNGQQNDWRNVVGASFDRNDDGLANNGSQGVSFDASHDDAGADLGNVAAAYLAMRPGNWVVYHNAREFGNGRDFPKDGRGDALGGLYGDAVTTLVNIRNTHGRGDYVQRHLDKETLVYERAGSAVVALNNRGDGGFDTRVVQTSFAPGTHLLELTGNAADGSVDPNNDIPEVVTVDGSGRVTIRAPRNASSAGQHGNGYVVYGLATPQGELTLSGTSGVLPGGTPTAATNGTTRLADLQIVKGDSFGVELQTQPVSLLGLSSLRDPNADGDNALLKVNAGVDANGNGRVDFTTPGSVAYGFENFTGKSSPLALGGDGQFLQSVDATSLPEGVNFVEVRAFRKRDDGGPAVFSSFKQAVYVDRLKPVSEVASVNALPGQSSDFRQVQIRSTDATADSVHTFLNLGAALTDAEVLARVSGGNRAGQIDRDLFAFGYDGVVSGNNVVTVVTYEPTGNVNVQRFAGLNLQTGRGRGVGDLNADGVFNRSDVFGPGAFEQVLHSQNRQFNPAADLTGDGRVDSNDLFLLEPTYAAAGASEAAFEARLAELRRGDLNASGSTDAKDIDHLYANLGKSDWLLDLDSDGGPSDRQDVDTLVREVFQSQYGDATLDGRVDLGDFLALRQSFGKSGLGWAGADWDGSGKTDLGDFLLLRQNFGFRYDGSFEPPAAGLAVLDAWAATVPEPSAAAAALALLGGLSLRRRRP